MRVFRQQQQVQRPHVRQPVRAGEHEEVFVGHAFAVDGDVAQRGQPLGGHLPGLARRGNFAVDGVVDGPERGVGVGSLRAKDVFGFGEGALRRQPQQLGHALVDEVGLGRIRGPVLAECAHQAGSGAEGEDVVCGGVGRAAAVVLQIVAGPDGGVGLIERKLLAARTRVRPAEQAMLPGEMALQRGPNLARELEIAGPHEVAQKHVHEHQVHVVMVVGEVAVGVQHPLFAREMDVGVPRTDGGVRGGHGCDVLALQPVANFEDRAVVVAERVEIVGPAPSGQHGAPGHAAVQHAFILRVPDRLGRNAHRWADVVEVFVGRVDAQGLRDGLDLGAARGEGLREIIRGDGTPVEDAIHGEEERRPPHLD